MRKETIQVFICGAEEDDRHATLLIDALRDCDVEGWWFLGNKVTKGGKDWRRVVEREIGKASAAVLVLSSAWHRADPIQTIEMPLIIDRLCTDKSFVVIPLYADVCNPNKWEYRKGMGDNRLPEAINLGNAMSACNPGRPLSLIKLPRRKETIKSFVEHLLREVKERRSEPFPAGGSTSGAAREMPRRIPEERSSRDAGRYRRAATLNGVASSDTRHWWSQMTPRGRSGPDWRITSLDTGFRRVSTSGTNVGTQATPGTLVVDAEGRAGASLVNGQLRVAWVNRYTGELEKWGETSSHEYRDAKLLAIAMAGNSSVRIVMNSAKQTVIASVSRIGDADARFRVLEELKYASKDAVFVQNRVLTIDQTGRQTPQLLDIDLDRVECIDAAKLGGKLVLAAIGLRGRDRVLLITSLATESDGSLVPRELGSWPLNIEAGEIGVVIVRDGGPGRRALVSDGPGHILQFDLPEVRG